MEGDGTGDRAAGLQTFQAWLERPWLVLILLAGGIYLAEGAITLILHLWPVAAHLYAGLLDATALTLAVIPGLYLLVLRPQLKHHQQMVLLIKALQANRENFASIVEKSPDGVLVLDGEGVIRYVNPAAERLLQRARDELAGHLFGFPVIPGSVAEIDVIRKNQQPGTAEMRMMETDWHGKEAILVSLHDVSDCVCLREQLREQSLSDELTGLTNRRGFLNLAEQQRKLAARNNCELTLFFMDLDHFKQINDTLGHKAGDQALIDTAEILKRTFRESDIVARIGGDEFAVLAINGDDGANDLGMRLQEEITAHNRNSGRPYQLSVSCGAIHCNAAQPLDAMIQQADQKMYGQKQAKYHADSVKDGVTPSGKRPSRPVASG